MSTDHSSIIGRIKLQVESLDSAEHVDNLADQLSVMLTKAAPVGSYTPSGTLKRNIGSQTDTRRNGKGSWEKGVGDMMVVGDDESSPPRSTISLFIEWMKTQRGLGRVYLGQGQAIDKSNAWSALSPKAKQILQEQRKAGRFGGETSIGAGKSPYAYVQDGLGKWGVSGAIAGISGSNYITDTVEEYEGREEKYARSVIRELFE